MLVGRSREIDAIHGLIEDARAGRGRALVLRGAPGIGKSALLELGRRTGRERGLRILTARGVESESRLAFASLGDVLRPVLAGIDRIPDPQRAALRAALSLGPPAASDRYAAYAATLSLLGAVAADGAVLILVDDGHWVDPPSREALVFCARRIADEPIAMLVASREQPPERLPMPEVENLELPPLGEEDSMALLEAVTASQPLAPAVAREILALAGGNPLALVELPGALSAAERAGGVALPRPLPPGQAIVEAYRRRVERLDPGARRALGVAATGEGAPAGAIVGALRRLGGDTGDLVAAEAAGFLRLDGDVTRLRHPLLRPIALELMEPSERREIHRALAEALDRDRDVEQRAWHLAEAAIGPDEVVAAALEAAATRAAARTGYATAATFLERAATVAPGPLRSGRDLLGAAQLAMAAGTRRADRACSSGSGGRGRAVGPRRDGPPARPGDPHDDEHRRRLHPPGARGADRARHGSDRRRRDARHGGPVAGHGRPGPRGAALPAGGARDRPRIRGRVAVRRRPAGERAHGRRPGARGADGLRRPRRLPGRGRSADPPGAEPGGLAHAHDLAGGLRPRRAVSRAMGGRARESGSLGFLGVPEAFGAELDFRCGRWREAEARAAEAVRSLEETGQRASLGFALITLATIEAALGRADDCRANARHACGARRRAGLGSIATYRGFALGLLEQVWGAPPRPWSTWRRWSRSPATPASRSRPS